MVAAGAGRTQALPRRGARFEVRHLDGAVCVTCIDGQVQVAHAGGTAQLSGGQQTLRYDDHALGRAEQLDAARMPGWRQGYLRFTDAPLGEVLDEINRYRTGKVVLLDRQLAAKPVTGRFQIHALDKAIVQMQRSFGLHARTLPGGDGAAELGVAGSGFPGSLSRNLQGKLADSLRPNGLGPGASTALAVGGHDDGPPRHADCERRPANVARRD